MLELDSFGGRIAVGPRSVYLLPHVPGVIKSLNPKEEGNLGVGDSAGVNGIRVGRGRGDFTPLQSGGFEVLASRNL